MSTPMKNTQLRAICLACGYECMPADVKDGICPACSMLRAPGYLERIASDAMPACFTPTREAFVRLARYAVELQRTGKN
jgi:hypothetical protein